MIFLFITALVSSGFASTTASQFPDRYDLAIKEATDLYLPGHDWRKLKAQYYQESRLDPNAVSPVGAAGVAQFMPATWDEVSSLMGYELVEPWMAEPAIHAGAFYMQRLRKGWSSPRPEADRHSLALASYNAGFGNILAAQRACKGTVLYAEIVNCLPQVTGRHSNETITYVKRIWGYYIQMLVGG